MASHDHEFELYKQPLRAYQNLINCMSVSLFALATAGPAGMRWAANVWRAQQRYVPISDDRVIEARFTHGYEIRVETFLSHGGSC